MATLGLFCVQWDRSHLLPTGKKPIPSIPQLGNSREATLRSVRGPWPGILRRDVPSPRAGVSPGPEEQMQHCTDVKYVQLPSRTESGRTHTQAHTHNTESRKFQPTQRQGKRLLQC
ncbi:hypothetical protein KIL84_006381 [Mauremys mutica]|uniref:Uncharacterized protein n=1 Tax=Mauremys mutica TaxID=74926 RepID=A0A9D3X1C9_9SAUR|nr:hypothetical protein KIL84_006381 [Mauremys mutica]